jgi:hypothetical protein
MPTKKRPQRKRKQRQCKRGGNPRPMKELRDRAKKCGVRICTQSGAYRKSSAIRRECSSKKKVVRKVARKSPKKRVARKSPKKKVARKSPKKRVARKSPKKKSGGRRKKSTWVKACQKHGYLKKGSFKPIPKKGSAAYKKIKASMKKM